MEAVAAKPFDVTIRRLEVRTYTVPTDAPESDGTLRWDATTLVAVFAHGGGRTGFGYTYTHAAAARLIADKLAPIVRGGSALDVIRHWRAMLRGARNLGRPGLVSAAISAVDVALWDLKAKLLALPLAKLLGAARDAVPVYGSGGFTSYDERRLARQLGGWVAAGIPRVKMKVGRDPDRDPARVRAARRAIGAGPQLFVDANGAYSRKQALWMAGRFADEGVVWFEEPVSSDDLAGLHLVRDRAPAGMDVAAGEYGSDLPYFRRMLEAEAVDTLQADGSRCGGITGLLEVDALCAARSLALSLHCCPTLHLQVGCHLRSLVHLEYFHDHVRIERALFDGFVTPVAGRLAPDGTRAGLGVVFKDADAARFAA